MMVMMLLTMILCDDDDVDKYGGIVVIGRLFDHVEGVNEECKIDGYKSMMNSVFSWWSSES